MNSIRKLCPSYGRIRRDVSELHRVEIRSERRDTASGKEDEETVSLSHAGSKASRSFLFDIIGADLHNLSSFYTATPGTTPKFPRAETALLSGCYRLAYHLLGAIEQIICWSSRKNENERESVQTFIGSDAC